MKLKLFCSVILICFSIYGFSDEFSDTVKPELIYDTSQLEANKILRVGVLYKIKPNWHIYWKNSGDSGLPTNLEFTLPEEFKVGEINWPLPNVYTREGPIVDYGYNDEVLLWSDVKIPKNYGKNHIPIILKTKWISCEKICIPGKAEFADNLKLNHKNKLFDSWIYKLPSDKNNYFDITEENNNNNYIITINNKGLSTNFKLIPNPGKGIEIEDIAYKETGIKQQEILFTVNVYPGHKVNNNIDTVITYLDKENTRQGFNYSLNIENLVVENKD